MIGPCAKQTVIAVISNNGHVLSGSNYCLKPQIVCPRKGMKTGEGYELCKRICRQFGHAEIDVIKKAGTLTHGATMYIIGHTYVCDDCKKACDDAGIKQIIIT